MATETYTEENKLTFLEAIPGELDGKENYLVELHPAVDNGVRLLTAPGNEIGVLFEQLQPGQPNKAVTVRLLGKDGTCKMIQGGPINKGQRVMGAAGGKVVAATAGNRSVGIKLTQAAGADGSRCQVLDIIEKV